nr:GAF domain-containing protein [Cytophagales bacterium]
MDYPNKVHVLKILSSENEDFFDGITRMAQVLFDVPIAFVGFFDNKRYWYKSIIGFPIKETPTQDTICKFFLGSNRDSLVINERIGGQEFKNHPSAEKAGIKFYAGAPIVSKTNSILGTVCVLDFKPREELSEEKVAFLNVLAKFVLNELSLRSLKSSVAQSRNYENGFLNGITNLVDVSLFKMTIRNGKLQRFEFLNQNHCALFPNAIAQLVAKKPVYLFKHIHRGDSKQVILDVIKGIVNQTPLHLHYRIKGVNGDLRWHSVRTRPFMDSDSESQWFGVIEDITLVKNYMETVKNVMFTVSHEIRRPVSNIVGLIDVIRMGKMDEKNLMEFLGYLYDSAQELDASIHKINTELHKVKARLEAYK